MPVASFAERANPRNYTIGGVRFWVSELLDNTVSPALYDGYIDLGCIEQAPLNQAITYQEHFCASTGFRLKDKKVAKEIASTFTVTLDEIDPDNLRLFFFGSTQTDIPYTPGGITVTGEIMRLYNDGRRILEQGINAASIVVHAGVAFGSVAVLGTDYTVETYYGYTALRLKSGSALITSGNPYVSVDYTADTRPSRDVNAMTNIQKFCKIKMQGVSQSGQQIEYKHSNCQISPTGDFNFNSNDWTQIQLAVELLNDSTNNPSVPYGTVRSFGDAYVI